ncbi:MAG TPA: GNAT family N-acetyltransferase, partial [Candidatus Nanoarchaeia archaeon]|nr:GNAT family N-acetyltransferase [Candidatus Nanoarchaeia archaeon]
GKKLVSFAESYCKDQAKKGIYLYTHPLHKAAIKLYKKLGYQKVNVFPNYYSNGDASILYGKLLK